VTVDLPGGSIRATDVYGGNVAGVQVAGDAVSLEVTDSPVFLFAG
jgi:hypothetical protein